MIVTNRLIKKKISCTHSNTFKELYKYKMFTYRLRQDHVIYDWVNTAFKKEALGKNVVYFAKF